MNDLIKFPTNFSIKIIGINSSELIQSTINNIKQIIPDFIGQPKIKISLKNSYISLTFEVFVTSKHMLDNLYLELNKNPLVKFTL
jgi:putative lipoic acid-binding regulatory protein